MAVEDLLRLGSATAQRWLAAGDAAGVVPGEESVTDLLLVSLAQLGGHQCRVIRLPKLDEARVGPDFVLWFVSDRNGQIVGLPVLVQAKRLYPDGAFRALNKPTFAHPQMALLLAIARRWGVVPVYALYQPPASTLSGGAPHTLPSACALNPLPCPAAGVEILPPAHPLIACMSRDEADLGVALVHAQNVANLVEAVGSKPTVADLSALAVPLACVAACHCLVLDAPDLAPGFPPDDCDDNADDLVASASRLIGSLSDSDAGNPVPVPEWLATVLLEGPTGVERRSIARQDITSDVDTVVVITDFG